MIKAVFFDIDDTLYSHRTHGVPASAKKAIEELRKQGVLVIASTGRHMILIDHLLGTSFPFDGYVTLTGQLCLDGQRRMFYGSTIPDADMPLLLRHFQAHRIPITFTEQNRRYISFVNDHVRSVLSGASTFIPPVESWHGDPVYQAVGFCGAKDALGLMEGLTGCRMSRWTKDTDSVDIIPADGGKAAGIRKTLEHYRLSPKEIIAFGDSGNDTDMLQFAGIGVAMGNAAPDAKNAADYVTTDIDDDGIFHALRHFHLL